MPCWPRPSRRWTSCRPPCAAGRWDKLPLRRIDGPPTVGQPAGMTRLIQGLGDLTGDYDALLSDVWGVIHNGRESHPVPCGALAQWRNERGPVVLISNSPRP